jgi:succinyl-diaminopimelate desuccinylase
MANSLIKLIKVTAIGPENNGEGEYQKSQTLLEILSEIGFDRIEQYDAEDSRVPSGRRPNIIAYLNGEIESERLWIVTHLDVVPPGEENLWKVTKPFDPILKNGHIYGRGSEDNGQSLVASIYATKAVKDVGLKPKRTIALAFVSDEEQGSLKGIQHLLSLDIFLKDDLIVVPDSGTPKGNFIEIAEKSILWLKIKTIGKQAHGSLPEKGLNANRIGMQVALALDAKLHDKYSAVDQYFSPPTSTFEPTKKDKNVDAVNIVPGEDIVFFDCRVLPRYNVEEVLSDVQDVVSKFSAKTGAKISVEVVQKQAAPSLVDGNAKIVALLKEALKKAREIDSSVGGVGGGTCAAFFRKAGIPAVVWSTIDEVPHSPDEYCKLSNMVEDAKIFALLSII